MNNPIMRDLMLTKTAAQVPCARTSLKVVHNGESGWAPRDSWTATGCEREWVCDRLKATAHTESVVTCKEAMGSRAATVEKVVVDRLALETGCPQTEIRVVSKTAWMNGSEQGFRLSACGNFFICTHANGRTDCKAALAAPPPPQSPAG